MRSLLEIAMQRGNKTMLDNGLAWRPVDHRDMPNGSLYMGQLKDRSLSVAASKFALQIVSALQSQTSLCD